MAYQTQAGEGLILKIKRTVSGSEFTPTPPLSHSGSPPPLQVRGCENNTTECMGKEEQ